MKSATKIFGREFTFILNETEAEWLYNALAKPFDFEDEEDEQYDIIRNCFLEALSEVK